MHDILQTLADATARSTPIVSDGAMGSMLIAADLPPGVAAETWYRAKPEAVEAVAVVVGANCGAGPEAIHTAIAEMAPVATVPLIAQANAGVPLVGRKAETVWDVTPEQIVEHALEYARLGARIIRGVAARRRNILPRSGIPSRPHRRYEIDRYTLARHPWHVRRSTKPTGR